MDLDYDEPTCEFRDEVRGFLAANRDRFPTKSYDTAEGFEQHRRWDRVLFDAGLSVIAWPEKYGGRDASFGRVSPTLDALAANGLRFTQGYSNSPVCSPTRFALMTGRYQYRLRGAAEEPIRSADRGHPALGLPPSHPTLRHSWTAWCGSPARRHRCSRPAVSSSCRG